MRHTALFFLFVFSAVGFTACSSYEKVLKSDDMKLKEEKALEYYTDGEYHRALPLFEELVSVHKGTQKAEQFYYYYAYCHYHTDQLLIAAYNFKNFAQTYPGSQYAEESMFMNAKCYYEMSPRASLDQDNTSKTINETQLFINTYPASTRIQEANGMIDAMRRKLEKKDYESAMLYFNMDNYKAAATAFTNLLKKYPDTPMADRIAYMALRSTYLYAMNSIDEKKPERLEQTLAGFGQFSARYPQSKYRRDAESIRDNAARQLTKLKHDASTVTTKTES